MPKVFYKIMAVWDIALYSELTLKQFFFIHGHTKIKRSIARPAGCYPFFSLNCNSVMCLSMHFFAIVRHSKHFFMFYHFVDMILPTKAFNNANIYAKVLTYISSQHEPSHLLISEKPWTAVGVMRHFVNFQGYLKKGKKLN